jgi:hypothetical protein
MERECPDCYELWASKEANEASKRIAWGAKVHRKTMLDSGTSKRPRLVHCVVSVRDHGTVEGLRGQSYQIAKSHGITGGSSVYHPFRKDKYDGQYTLQDCVHFHIIGLAPKDIVQGGLDEDLETAFDYMAGRMMDLPLLFMEHRGLSDWSEVSEDQKDEWVLKIVRKSVNRTKPFFKVIQDDEYKDYRGFRSGRAIKRCVQYLLTHCGIIEGTHALTYWGSLSNRTLPASAIHALFPVRRADDGPDFDPIGPDSKVNPECPVCGCRDTESCSAWDSTSWSDRHNVSLHLEPDWSPDEIGPYESVWDCIIGTLTKDAYGNPRSGLTEDELFSYIFITDEETASRFRAVLKWNLETGRLVEDDYGKLRLGPTPYSLDKALNEARFISSTAKGDDKLRELILKNPSADNPIMSDDGFVFDSLLERFDRGCGWC